MTFTDTTNRASELLEDASIEVADLPEETRSVAEHIRSAFVGVMDRMPDVVGAARSGADQVAEHFPDAVGRARVGAQETTASLQTLPDHTLRLLAAASLGLAAGLFLRGAPRVITLVAVAPAVLLGGAIATRPAPDPRAAI
jgi:hypothetical protein